MIRDPSDGSVREAPKAETGIPVSKPMTGPIPAMPGPDTGIRQPTRTDAQERLERSREWLKSYFEEQRNARGNREQAAGDLQDRGGG